MVEMISNAKAPTMLKSILKVARVYTSRGFGIKKLLMDGEFEFLCRDLLKNHVNLNICSESKHVEDKDCQN